MLFVEVLDFLVVHTLQLVLSFPISLEFIAFDSVYELVLELLPPLVLHGLVGDILEAECCWLGTIGVVIFVMSAISESVHSSTSNHIESDDTWGVCRSFLTTNEALDEWEGRGCE